VSISFVKSWFVFFQQNAWTTFRVGFFAGIFAVMVMLAIVSGMSLIYFWEKFLNIV